MIVEFRGYSCYMSGVTTADKDKQGRLTGGLAYLWGIRDSEGCVLKSHMARPFLRSLEDCKVWVYDVEDDTLPLEDIKAALAEMQDS